MVIGVQVTCFRERSQKRANYTAGPAEVDPRRKNMSGRVELRPTNGRQITIYAAKQQPYPFAADGGAGGPASPGLGGVGPDGDVGEVGEVGARGTGVDVGEVFDVFDVGDVASSAGKLLRASSWPRRR